MEYYKVKKEADQKSMKEDFIKAYTYMYGSTKKKAFEIYRTADKSYISTIVSAFKCDAQKTFYND